MSQLMVVAFDDKHRADEVLLQMLKIGQTHLSALDDAVVVTRNAEGKIRVRSYHDLLSPVPELSNDIWGGVISAVIFHRTLTIAKDVFDANFLVRVEEYLQPNCSALMVIVRDAESAALEQGLASTGGKLVKTALPEANQQKIKASVG
jgi:uncharacterized membrane protein